MPILQYANTWLTKLKSKAQSKRDFVVFGENIKGKSILLPRYLRPLQPPADLINLDSEDAKYAIEKSARFVSMIPFLVDLNLFKDLPDMYANCQEFLDLGGGDHEEHAILLANFFQYIDDKRAPGKYRSYLVYGYALPEGHSVYVMRTNSGKIKDFELWDPISGLCYFFEHKANNETVCGISFYS